MMATAKIKLNTIDDVKTFVNVASSVDFDIDLVSGRYTVDAKSIMGIFSLDLTKEIEVRAYTSDMGKLTALRDKCSRFITQIISY